MLKVSRQSTTMWVLLIWTAGVVAIWFIADLVLNPGVSEDDIRECAEEGFIPPAECKETLEMIEAGQEPVLGVGASLAVWLAGVLVLAWVMSRPGPAG
jgi:hypothetical protein